MEKEKVLFVYNPRAGKGTLRNKLADIIDLMMKRQWDVSIAATQKAGFDGLKGYGLHLGAKAPIAAGTLTAGLYYVDAKEDLTADADQDFKYYGVSARYVYPLSKRTSVYGGAGYGQTSVDNAAANGSDQDTKLVQAYVGLSHTF